MSPVCVCGGGGEVHANIIQRQGVKTTKAEDSISLFSRKKELPQTRDILCTRQMLYQLSYMQMYQGSSAGQAKSLKVLHVLYRSAER